MDPDQTARMRRLVWIHAGHNPIVLVLSKEVPNEVLFKESIQFVFLLKKTLKMTKIYIIIAIGCFIYIYFAAKPELLWAPS
jgi:hypothetical protein